ncbi:MAG: hypothetical protein N3E39_02015 [Candidatus Methanomethylicia archaeon]|nr:hypothetical protein [Candidatus Methanomethylicia archaeon]
MFILNSRGLSNLTSYVIVCLVFLSMSLISFQIGLNYQKLLDSNVRFEETIDFLMYLKSELNKLTFTMDSKLIYNPGYIIKVRSLCSFKIFINNHCLGEFSLTTIMISISNSHHRILHDNVIRFNGSCGSIFLYNKNLCLIPSISISSINDIFYVKCIIFNGSINNYNGNFVFIINSITKLYYTGLFSQYGFNFSYVSEICSVSETINVNRIAKLIFEIIYVGVKPL